MKQYIDKSDIVVEIERLDNYWHLSKSAAGQAFIENLLSFLDTIKTKEVDLEKEINLWIEDNTCKGYCSADIHETAEYFFEFGLKAQKGE